MIVSDKSVRNAITDRVSRFRPHHSAIRLVEELELERGAARIDMAFFGEDLLGVEIKSPKDTLSRLPEQARVYSRVFDRVVIVAASSFIPRVLEIVPDWWGVLSIYNNENRIFFRQERRPRVNPSVEIEAVIQLLWKDELLMLLNTTPDVTINTRLSRPQLRHKVLEAADTDQIKVLTLKALMSRENWRDTMFASAK
jgi:hypothetical protein